MIVDANAMGGCLVINSRSGQGPNAVELRREAERLDIDARILGPGRRPGRSRPRSAGGRSGRLAGTAHWRRSRTWRSSGAGLFVVVPFERATTWRGISGSTAMTRFTALRAFGGRQAQDRRGARVNGRLFLNNVSLGLYARMVHEQDGGNTLAQLKALGPSSDIRAAWA